MLAAARPIHLFLTDGLRDAIILIIVLLRGAEMKKIVPLLLSLFVLPCLLKAEQTIFLVGNMEATATLSDPSDDDDARFQRSGMYSVRKMADGDPATCWAVGKGGIGEKIYVLVKPGAKSIKIINGLAKNKNLHLANNRVRSFKVTAYAGFTSMKHITEIGEEYVVWPFAPTAKLVLKDTMNEQSLRFPFNWKELEKLGRKAADESESWARAEEPLEGLMESIRVAYILSLEISELYRGTKYNDTCISELSIK
jgi:hypothetical protein